MHWERHVLVAVHRAHAHTINLADVLLSRRPIRIANGRLCAVCPAEVGVETYPDLQRGNGARSVRGRRRKHGYRRAQVANTDGKGGTARAEGKGRRPDGQGRSTVAVGSIAGFVPPCRPTESAP